MESPSNPPHWARVPLFHIRAVRDLFFIALLVLTVYVGWKLRIVAVPALLAFVCAVLADPVVSRLERLGVPRLVSALAAVFVVGGSVTAFLSIGLPPLIEEVNTLAVTLPARLQELGVPASLTDPLKRLDDGDQVARLLAGIGNAYDFVSGTLASLVSGVVVSIFTIALFVFFTIRFPMIEKVETVFEPRVATLLHEMLEVFKGYMRGQVLVALWTTAGFAVGFTIAGVPFALVAAALGGAFSFIPNGQALGWLSALAFGVLELVARDQGHWVSVLVYPSIVFAVTHGTETFVITPLVQGSATRIHPLAVLGSLIAGATFGGLLGIFLATPIAACAAVLLRREIIPGLKRRAEGQA
ncbi:MAG: AI-2E family transporter [Myxococcota bacterium]